MRVGWKALIRALYERGILPASNTFNSLDTRPNSGTKAAKHRRIVLTGLPEPSTPTFVASLVYGGPLESVRTTDGKVAFVTFLRAEDATKYYDATANDLLFKKDGAEHVITTQLGKDVDPVSGVLKEWIEKEFTRCVRAVGVEKDWSVEALNKFAGNKGRKVEKVIDGSNKNGVSVIYLSAHHVRRTRWRRHCSG